MFNKSINVDLETVYKKLGFEIALFLLVVVAFYRSNIMSILYVLFAVFFAMNSLLLQQRNSLSRKKLV